MRSLSLLVCVVLLLPTGCQKSQERAIAEIEELGGFAKTASDQPGSPVVNVLLYGEKITDSKLAVVETFAQLQTLDLKNAKIGDTSLVHLEKLVNLRALGLTNTSI